MVGVFNAGTGIVTVQRNLIDGSGVGDGRDGQFHDSFILQRFECIIFQATGPLLGGGNWSVKACSRRR
jgi:hypothetical protein